MPPLDIMALRSLRATVGCVHVELNAPLAKLATSVSNNSGTCVCCSMENRFNTRSTHYRDLIRMWNSS